MFGRKARAACSVLAIGAARLQSAQAIQAVTTRSPALTSVRGGKISICAALPVQTLQLSDGPVTLEISIRTGPAGTGLTAGIRSSASSARFQARIPARPFHPHDDRITSLGLHHHIDPAIGHGVVTGLPGHSLSRKESSAMAFRLPDALLTDDDKPALGYLRSYYEHRPGTPLGTRITGARFDTWDSTGARHADSNRLTADDLVAVSFLAVQVHPGAARELLAGNPDRFNRQLAEIDASADLADINPPASARSGQPGSSGRNSVPSAESTASSPASF